LASRFKFKTHLKFLDRCDYSQIPSGIGLDSTISTNTPSGAITKKLFNPPSSSRIAMAARFERPRPSSLQRRVQSCETKKRNGRWAPLGWSRRPSAVPDPTKAARDDNWADCKLQNSHCHNRRSSTRPLTLVRSAGFGTSRLRTGRFRFVGVPLHRLIRIGGKQMYVRIAMVTLRVDLNALAIRSVQIRDPAACRVDRGRCESSPRVPSTTRIHGAHRHRPSQCARFRS